jgi:hypothetical protein
MTTPPEDETDTTAAPTTPVVVVDTVDTAVVADSPVICAADAFQCADGAWVGRAGADCAFAPCVQAPVVVDPVVSAGACAAERRFCPDGSAVVQSGPACVWQLCPDLSAGIKIDAGIAVDGNGNVIVDAGAAAGVAPTAMVTVLFAIALSLLQL